MLSNYLNQFLYFKNYLLLAVISMVFILMITRRNKQKKPEQQQNTNVVPIKSIPVVTSHDIKAIAGDDVMATQLDLARAYIELGKKQLAKKILNHVYSHGDVHQQTIAQQLMINL